MITEEVCVKCYKRCILPEDNIDSAILHKEKERIRYIENR